MLSSFLGLLSQPVELNSNEQRDLVLKRSMSATIDPKMGVIQPERINVMLSISSRVIERLLPFLGRVAKASPERWASLTAALKAKGVAAADSAAGIVAYARQNPMNATLVFTTIASLGVSVADLFSSEDKADMNTRGTAVALDRLTINAAGESDMLIARTAAASETLRVGVADREVEIRALADICRWAKSHFGSANSALDAHQKLQAFVELPFADLETGFRLLR